MTVNIKNGGFEISDNGSKHDRVYVFTWNKGANHKIYWGTNKACAIQKFQQFAGEYFETISEASLWFGDVEQELLIESVSEQEIQKATPNLNALIHLALAGN